MTYDHFHGDGYAASLIEGIYGAFSLVGIAILFIWGGGKRLLRVVALSGTFSGIILIATGLLSPSMFFWFAVLTAISGVVESMYNGPLLAVVQKRVPPEKLGRVMGLFSTVTALSSPIGLGLAGTCAEFTGVAMWFVISGVVVTAGGLAIGLLPSLRKLDREVAATFDEVDVRKTNPTVENAAE